MRNRILLAITLVVVAVVFTAGYLKFNQRFEENEALIRRYIEENHMSMVTIPYGDSGVVLAFPRAQGESIQDWAERVRGLQDQVGEIDAKKYKCGELTGCDVPGTGKITVCIFIGTMTPEQVNQELEEALDAFREQFGCDA